MIARGEDHYRAKVLPYQVRMIRDLHERHFGYGSIARIFGLSRSAVRRIVNRITWKHLS